MSIVRPQPHVYLVEAFSTGFPDPSCLLMMMASLVVTSWINPSMATTEMSAGVMREHYHDGRR